MLDLAFSQGNKQLIKELILYDWPLSKATAETWQMSPGETSRGWWLRFLDPEQFPRSQVRKAVLEDLFSVCSPATIKRLAFFVDRHGREALKLTDYEAKNVFFKYMYFCGRYEFKNSDLLYISDNSIIVRAVDHVGVSEEYGAHFDSWVGPSAMIGAVGLPSSELEKCICALSALNNSSSDADEDAKLEMEMDAISSGSTVGAGRNRGMSSVSAMPGPITDLAPTGGLGLAAGLGNGLSLGLPPMGGVRGATEVSWAGAGGGAWGGMSPVVRTSPAKSVVGIHFCHIITNSYMNSFTQKQSNKLTNRITN